ncbi:MAG: DUF4127 family protein [Oscillospiraceae bacterium]|nr:DUF4127 family protein [Oscillospiraceae bacterium]
MKKKILIACAAALVLMAAAAAAWYYRPAPPIDNVLESLDVNAETVAEWRNVIAYVPLDDRTDNMEDVVYLAEASGYRVVMPEGDVYCTKLDGQKPNRNGTQHGDREALMEWVKEMDEQGCDLFLMSLDQLFSGGLVHSRYTLGEELVFDDGTTMSEAEAFDAYILSLTEDPKNRIYLFDSVVRLASTVGYEGFGIDEYYALREYGMVARPALTGEELTLENIFANYPYAADGVTPAENALADNTYAHVLTEELIADYNAVRVRKLTLLDHVMKGIKGSDNIHLIIGIDDSSNTENIQYNELHYIEKQLGEGATLMAGLDSLARLLVGQIAQESYDYEVKASVRYVGGTEMIPSSEFDLYTLEEVVDLHMDLFKAVRVSEEEAELQVVVMTAPDDETKAQAYCEELVSLLEYNEEHNIPTAFIEASNNAYGETLEKMLLERVDFAHLMSFAGKYDQANVTGAGFAMGFSRYLYLRCCEDKTAEADLAQAQQIANSMALTYGYTLHTRYPLNLYVMELGYDYNNILTPSRDGRLIQDGLEQLFFGECVRISEALEGGRLISELNPVNEKTVHGVSFSEVYMPWNRTFEISFTIDVESLLTPIAGVAEEPAA